MSAALAFWLVSLDVEINPRFYRGRANEQSNDKKGELKASPKSLQSGDGSLNHSIIQSGDGSLIDRK